MRSDSEMVLYAWGRAFVLCHFTLGAMEGSFLRVQSRRSYIVEMPRRR